MLYFCSSFTLLLVSVKFYVRVHLFHKFDAGFTNCQKSRWSHFEDISRYNDQSIENFGLFKVHREDVTFRLWTRSQTNVYVPIYYGHLQNEDSFRVNQPFKIVIHGWSDCGDSKWYGEFKDAYLKKGDYNVILVDWTKPAGALYPFSVGYTRDVGKYVGELIVDLNQTLGVPYENVHLIGHSLGSHISGFAGKHVQAHAKKTIGRISGMDPAGPLFLLANSASRLDRSDALFVDVIHTDGGKFGYSNELGHADFYPNGGHAPQTGCVLFENVADVGKFT